MSRREEHHRWLGSQAMGQGRGRVLLLLGTRSPDKYPSGTKRIGGPVTMSQLQ